MNSMRGVEKASFSMPSINFSLHGVKIGLVHLSEISSFREILSEKFVGVFDRPFWAGNAN